MKDAERLRRDRKSPMSDATRAFADKFHTVRRTLSVSCWSNGSRDHVTYKIHALLTSSCACEIANDVVCPANAVVLGYYAPRSVGEGGIIK